MLPIIKVTKKCFNLIILPNSYNRLTTFKSKINNIFNRCISISTYNKHANLNNFIECSVYYKGFLITKIIGNLKKYIDLKIDNL